MKRSWVLIGLGVFLIITGLVTAKNPAFALQTDRVIRVGEHVLLVEQAITPEKQARGLANRWCRLSDQQGMYFVYAEATTPTFWMNTMRFPIDLLWIQEGMVVGWETNLVPDHGEQVYLAPVPIDRVLEVRAGWVDAHAIALGDQVEELPSS
ncbi:DUF192 domain-containing protein [Candidatus Berkelbacteria bacterium]|nr:DUF192 domain-containing protein [Candidatus Berkelbacteria bacterium]